MRNEFKASDRAEGAIDLQGCLVQVEASKAWFARRVLPLSIEQIRWRPEPRHWSIAECLDHLNITLGLYLPKIDRAIDCGLRHDGSLAGCKQFEASELEALKLAEPPVKAPVASPPAVIPASAVDPDRLVDCFYQNRDRYAGAVRRAFDLDLPHILLVEPIYPSIHSLGGTLAFLAAHDRRHIWQVEQIRAKRRFPRAVFQRRARTSR